MSTAARLLLHPDLEGARQMAIDEALFQNFGSHDPPVFRFYTWKRPTLSLGYFQNYKTIVQEPFCVHNKIDVVRRITGGRAVLHHAEVTYAVVASLARGIFQEHSLQETYQLIAKGLNLGLQRLGMEQASVSSTLRDRTRSSQCFVSVSRYEISSGLRKVIGSAQKRTKDRFLQHGSILLDFDPQLQRGCILQSDPELENRVAPIQRALGRTVAFEEVATQFAEAFEEALNIRVQASELTGPESILASELQGKYQSREWTERGCR
jgi:lipoyl(octanoyl) transferase